MLGHKQNSKAINYLGAKSDGLSKYTLGNKDHQTSHSLHNFKSTSDKPLKLVIELSDAQGKIVLTQNFSFNKDGSAHTLNITQLSVGLYFLKVRHNTDVFKVVKLIKE